MLAYRDEALVEIEADCDRQKKIGKALEAKVEIWLHDIPLPGDLSSTLAEIINVSSVEVKHVSLDDFVSQFPELGGEKIESGAALSKVIALQASGTKCNRCWRYTDDTSSYGNWENVCTRCQSALREMGIEPPQSVEPIVEANQ